MAKHGVSLGADLYELWSAGEKLLPTAAASINSAYVQTPVSVAGDCERSGPIGMGHNGPAGGIDAVLDRLNKALQESGRNLQETGNSLVWLANEYAETDARAAQEFHRKQRDIDHVGG